VLAYYLPQFHPIPENDTWWGKGFTEWTNVAKAKPLFKGHYQPHIPADLGFYDLRLPLVREQQAQMARDAGIEGFCYWHYWFGNGKRLLERPFMEVLESGKPDFPFCLAWANHDWSTKSWKNNSSLSKENVLMEQTYSEDSYEQHFYDVLPAFKDKRYITVDGKPLFVVFRAYDIPEPARFVECWNNLAVKNGLSGIHFVAKMNKCSLEPYNKSKTKIERIKEIDKCSGNIKAIIDYGFNAVNTVGIFRGELYSKGRIHYAVSAALTKHIKTPFLLPVEKYKMNQINKYLFTEEDKWENVYPTIIPNWDRSPRSGKFASVYVNSTPDVFKAQILSCLPFIEKKTPEHKIIFLQSWNEWGEGNYVEPDIKYGHGYLDALRETLIV
jgi:hypothetical protein